MERSVRRAELQSEADSASSSPNSDVLERLKRDVKLEYRTTSLESYIPEPDKYDGTVHEELEFRLFATTKSNETNDNEQNVRKVRLISPSTSIQEPKFIRPYRGDDYYFTGSLTTVEDEGFQKAAVSGEDVVARAKTPWPGTTYLWKIIHLPSSAIPCSLRAGDTSSIAIPLPHSTPEKRKRPGKKDRIKNRKNIAGAHHQQQESARLAQENETMEREKRTRRNRGKKVKKKAREKAQKAESATNGDPGRAEVS